MAWSLPTLPTLPTPRTLAGAAIVAATCPFTLWRERRVSRRRIAAEAALRVHEASGADR